MNRLIARWEDVQASFWFTPGLVVVLSAAGALLLIQLDTSLGADLSELSARLFGASAEGTRAMLSAIATSMITVAGVVFSITIVALSLTSTQYSPRLLRSFMSDRPTQFVLGVFVGVYTYCLIVLRTVRGGEDEGRFIPSVAVLGSMLYAAAAVAMLIYFIHHLAQSIQASSILGRIADETEHAIEQLFPQRLGDPIEETGIPSGDSPEEWTWVSSESSGYLMRVDGEALMDLALATGRVVRVRFGIGSFIAAGSPFIALAGQAPIAADCERRLRDAALCGRSRTVQQDAAFGLQQLVDVALRALSPGINDPTTATMAIDHIGALMAKLADRHLPLPNRGRDGELLLIAPVPDFSELVGIAFEPLVRYSRGDVQVIRSLESALAHVGSICSEAQRVRSIRQIVQQLTRSAHAHRLGPGGSDALRRSRRLERRLRRIERGEKQET